jgi:HSP20 family protein
MAQDWQREMERYLEHFKRAGKRPTVVFTHNAAVAAAWIPAMDMYETDTSLVILLDLAGVDADQTEVGTEPHLLTVRGVRRERHSPHAPGERRNYLALEIPYGRFERSVQLPAGIDTSAAQATYRDGLLEITLPKRLPRHVPISTTSDADSAP